MKGVRYINTNVQTELFIEELFVDLASLLLAFRLNNSYLPTPLWRKAYIVSLDHSPSTVITLPFIVISFPVVDTTYPFVATFPS